MYVTNTLKDILLVLIIMVKHSLDIWFAISAINTVIEFWLEMIYRMTKSTKQYLFLQE